MNVYGLKRTWMAVAILFLLGQAVSIGLAETQAGLEVQTRGPVHEGYAEPAVSNPESGLVVSQAPPQAIEEMPPDQRPDDDTAIWVPGYWGWDDDRNDFIWISGIWRIPPPGYNWVPGYWAKAQDGYQWIPGFWQPVTSQEIAYLPPPPQSLEVGPTGPSPTPDNIWCPGTWYWQETRYVWRPGFWMPGRLNWVWTPAHYVWTPRGTVFVSGYWDYPIDHRGILFAPVYVERKVYFRQPYVYTPSVVISTGALAVHLFTRPRYEHYYFGDYYANEYAKRGIRPWFELSKRHPQPDPIFAYEKWRYRHEDPNWSDKIRRDFKMRQDRVELRPVRTFSQQQTVIHNVPDRDRRTVIIGQPLKEYSSNKNVTLRVERLKPEYRDQINRHDVDYRKFAGQRAQWETQSVKGKPGKEEKVQIFRQRNIKVPTLVIPGKQDTRGRTLVVPPRPEPPKTNLLAQPRQPTIKLITPAPGPGTDRSVKPRIVRPEDKEKDKNKDKNRKKA